ncbi:hypothetical protein ACP4OV_019205 [Aristida adscensionis]
MESLPHALLGEIVKWVTDKNDRSSLSLVSKLLYTVEAEQRDSLRIGCSLCLCTVAVASLCSRFPNLCKVEINYSGWNKKKKNSGMQLDNQGLHILSSSCLLLTDLTLSFCSYINDSGLGCLTSCKKLQCLRLTSLPAISSVGLLGVVVGCRSLSALHLIGFEKQWMRYHGQDGVLDEVVTMGCKGVNQYDLLQLGPGWTKLQKFEFRVKGFVDRDRPCDPSYVPNCQYNYDFSCEALKDLTLARVVTVPEVGLRCLLSKCKALEKLSLHYVFGISDSDMISLSHICNNLRSISLRLLPLRLEGRGFTTPLTDESLKALALRCPILQSVEIIIWGCDPSWPSELSFTQEGLVTLIQSCPIRDLVLSGANCFDDVGMKTLSCAQFLESLELVYCVAITDAGIRLLAQSLSLLNLTLRYCQGFTDYGVGEVVRTKKLETLIVEGCSGVSLKAVQGSAKSVRYKDVNDGDIDSCLLDRIYY